MRRYLHLMLPTVLALAGPACETGGEPRILRLSGQVRDYYTAAALPNVALTWGTALSVMSTNTGFYQIDNLMELDILFITGTVANYRPTRNEPVVLGRTSATADLVLVSTADAARQYTAVGETQAAGTATVIVNLRNADGMPHTGIPVADIVIEDTQLDPVGTGPFVFGAGGDVVSNATLNVTSEFSGRSRVAFLNVPAGNYTLRVTYTDSIPRVKTSPVVAVPGGVALLRR